MIENIQPSQQQLIPKAKLIETLNGFLEKPQEEILLSEIETALEPFWEMRHDEKGPLSNRPDSEAMDKLAELIKEYKENRKD